MSLQDPTTKMSKSDPNLKATIFLKDDDKTIVSKIKRAVTDSGSIVPNSLDDYSIGLRNLLYLRWASMDRDLHLLVGESAGKQYGEFKQQVAEDVVEKVRPIRERYLSYRADEVRLCQVLRQGADKARGLAAQTLSCVYEKIGFLAK